MHYSYISLNTTQTYDFAYQMLVKYLIPSLENDVNLCLSRNYQNNTSTNAYVPALLYCFSIIDILGALLKGHARRGETTKNMKDYMEKYMPNTYDSSKIDLILKIYRHKIVHLGMPKPIIEHNGKYLSWNLHDQDPDNHLEIDNIPGYISIFGYRKDHYDGKFILHIQQFKNDIVKSITSTNGYLEELKKDNGLQKKFGAAINQIYNPFIKD